MIDFFRRRISAKIILGYLATILLMVAFAFFTINVQSQIVLAVDDLIQNLEAEKTLAQSIVTHMALARSYANAYVKDPVQSNLDLFIDQISQLDDLLKKENDLVSSPERKHIIDEIRGDMHQYGFIFSEIARLTQKNQEIEAELAEYELNIDNRMTALRVHINTKDDSSFSLLYGNMHTAYLSMRLNIMRYISLEDERYSVLVHRDFEETRSDLADLQNMLDDPVQVRNASEAYEILDSYHDGFLSIQENQVEMRRLFSEGLDVLEPKITAAVNSLAQSVEQEFSNRNEAVREWAKQMRVYIIGVTVFLFVFSLGFGIFFSYNITRPLRQVMSVSQQIANKDLSMLASQMSTLSHGDVDLRLDISAQPLLVSQQDEVGQMARSFNEIIFRLQDTRTAFEQMVVYLNEMADAARSVAQGNLNTEIKIHSDQDVLAQTLIDMVENLRSVQDQLLNQLSRLATLHEVDGMITTNQDLSAILTFVLNQALEHLDVAVAELYLLDEETREPKLRTHAGSLLNISEENHEMFLEYLQQAIDTQQHCAFDLSQNLYDRTNFPFKSLYISPLILQEHVIGALLVLSRCRLAPNGDRDTFLETLAGQAAIAINNYELVRGLEDRVVQRTRELQSSRRYYKSLVTYSPVAIIVMDLEDKITQWNPAAEKLFGYTIEETRGHNLDDLIAGDKYRDEANLLTRQVSESIVHIFTHRYRKDGSEIDVEVFGEPIFVEGERLGSLAIYHDITDLQRARQTAEEATRTKSQFLANMSHEIRTPMNGVIGMTSLLLDTPLTDLQQDYVETIRVSSESLLSIVNDILDFSKIEAGRMELELHPFNLRDCIESALDLISHQAAGKQLELAYLMSSKVPEYVMGDETRLRQILTNLLSNAVKFTEQGEITLTVREDETSRVSANDTILHFCVRDTGIGIPEDRLHRLFQSFSQVDASTTRKYGGTGLGLAISKKLSELMGGDIWVESEGVGKGSSFHVVLPLAEAAGMPDYDHQKILTLLKDKRIFIVDDNATNRDVFTHMALNFKMQPFVFATGREMLRELENGASPDLAILDIQMPEMDGITLAVEIRKLRRVDQLPILFLTSLGRKEQIPDGIEAKAYLQKPIKLSQFYDAMAAVFSDHPAHMDRLPEASSFDAGMAVKHPLRILLAEDHPVNQRVALLTLEKLGYRADVVSNGLEVIQAFERQDYDVVLMDAQMPEMDGIGATQHLRRSLPAKRQPYIIALTANVLSGDRERYLAAGMDDYLGKPMHVNQLVKALNRCNPAQSKKAKITSLTPPVETNIDNQTPVVEIPVKSSASTAPVDEAILSPVDMKVLNDYFPGFDQDTSFLQGVVNMYIEDTPQRLETLREMILKQEIEMARTTAHALKSASLNFGATHLSELFKDIEMKARSGKLDGVFEIFEDIQAEYRRVESKLKELINR